MFCGVIVRSFRDFFFITLFQERAFRPNNGCLDADIVVFLSSSIKSGGLFHPSSAKTGFVQHQPCFAAMHISSEKPSWISYNPLLLRLSWWEGSNRRV